MKRNVARFIKSALILILGVLITMVIFWFVDQAFDGLPGDWVESRYYMQIGYPTEDGYNYETFVQWGLVKQDLFSLLIINTIFWLTVVLAATGRARRQEQKRIEKFKQEIMRQEQALKEETSRKNDLIAYLAHDLKTPLTSVIGYLSLLDEAPDMPCEQRTKYTRITLDKANRLEKMINEFFDITRYNLHEISIQKEPIDLYYMLVQLIDELTPTLTAHGNTAVLNAPENLTLSGDPDKLARVFNNVLKNAAAYSYPDTEITITAGEKSGAVTIRFENQGRTISPEKLAAIFEKFYRLDDARTSGTGGAGLGLAIAKEIVTLHGGSITAESANDRVAFTITLPAS